MFFLFSQNELGWNIFFFLSLRRTLRHKDTISSPPRQNLKADVRDELTLSSSKTKVQRKQIGWYNNMTKRLDILVLLFIG